MHVNPLPSSEIVVGISLYPHSLVVVCEQYCYYTAQEVIFLWQLAGCIKFLRISTSPLFLDQSV